MSAAPRPGSNLPQIVTRPGLAAMSATRSTRPSSTRHAERLPRLASYLRFRTARHCRIEPYLIKAAPLRGAGPGRASRRACGTYGADPARRAGPPFRHALTRLNSSMCHAGSHRQPLLSSHVIASPSPATPDVPWSDIAAVLARLVASPLIAFWVAARRCRRCGSHGGRGGWRGSHRGRGGWRGSHSGRGGWRGSHSGGCSWRGGNLRRRTRRRHGGNGGTRTGRQEHCGS